MSKHAALFVAGLCAAVIFAEAVIGLISPHKPKREVEDAVRELETADPDVLVISSSHGRSFHVLGQEVARRTNGAVRVVAFPVEAGMLQPMDWVLHNRAVPLLDEPDDSGKAKRTRLRHLILGITWFDSCRRGPLPRIDHNVVSRAWTWHDYLNDVRVHGMDELNRNFVRYRIQRAVRFSRLAQLQAVDPLQRFADVLVARIHALTAGGGSSQPEAPSNTSPSPELLKWRHDIETAVSCLLSVSELEALQRMEMFAQQRALTLTVVLFPLMPQTVTPSGRSTLERFAALMQQRGQQMGYRVLDMTLLPIFSDADFMRDMDHLSASGNAKFVDWALSHDLSFLVSDRTRDLSAAGRRTLP